MTRKHKPAAPPTAFHTRTKLQGSSQQTFDCMPQFKKLIMFTDGQVLMASTKIGLKRAP